MSTENFAADAGWRRVSTGQTLDTDRLPVPGGWLYRTCFAGPNEFSQFDPRSVSTTFVADSSTEWQETWQEYRRGTSK